MMRVFVCRHGVCISMGSHELAESRHRASSYTTWGGATEAAVDQSTWPEDD